MSAIARLRKFVDYKGISKYKFYQLTGIANGYLDREGSIGSDKCEQIISAFPELNVVWLTLGQGEMLLSEDQGLVQDSPEVRGFSIPLLPISAQGGALTNLDISVCELDCERIISPIRNVDFAITISGDSMAPDYPNGSQILIKKYDFSHFIEWGRVYVLDTANGSIVKKLMPDDSPDNVRCESLNPFYPPFSVPLSDIRGMYRVLMVMALR